MGKIVFIINKTSDDKYQECAEAINNLKIPASYSIAFATYNAGEVYTSNVYLNVCNQENPDISIIMDDTVIAVNENLLLDVVEIFQSDSSIGVIGVKQAEPSLDRVSNAWKEYAQAEAVKSTFVAVRGYIPIWKDISNRCIGEILSVAAAIQGKKVVIPRDSNYWCFASMTEVRPTDIELETIKTKYQFRNILLSKTHCILTIGIPTYNRSKYFRKCISNLYKHVGDMPWVEVFVSNNDSTDDTEKIASQYLHHKNFRYYKQPVNIVAKNFDYLYENAKGDFVVACGDDDYYSPEAILNLLETICLYPEATLIELDWSGPVEVIPGKGMDSFLVRCMDMYTCISSIVMNHKRYMEVDVKDRFSHTSLNQCYVELEMIRKDPRFVVLRGSNFLPGSGEETNGRKLKKEDKLSFCNIFVREYYPILDYFLDKGLSRKAYEKEKILNIKKVLFWLNRIKAFGDDIKWLIDDDIEELMEEFYGYEPYYNDLKQKLNEILKK